MKTSLEDPVRYNLLLDDQQLSLNDFIGQTVHMRHTGAIHCLACNRKTKKSFNQGFCYPCFRRLAQCDSCIIKPELCHFDAGTCREPDWAQSHCMQPHYVYLANSSGVKVGITRNNQIPTRWIDQGAHQALPIFKVANRRLSGLVEVILKQHVSDRTDWRRMLKGEPEPVDLVARRDELLAASDSALKEIVAKFQPAAVEPLTDGIAVDINYPVTEYPKKVTAHNFDKTSEVSGQLLGIKGQYLILDTGVLNIRKFGGYKIEFTAV